MRIAPFLLLLSLLVSAPVWAQSDDSKREIPDGMTITATGSAGEFRVHRLIIWLNTLDETARTKVTAALSTLRLSTVPSDPNSPHLMTAGVPDGNCDGQRIGGVPRARLVETLEATGVVHNITLRSYTDSNISEAVQKKALGAAMQNARAKAQEVARQGGGRLGSLLGMEYEVETLGEARVLLLTRDKIQTQEPGGDRIKVVARYSLQK
ncbi:MAG: SIMPL domain-containing protein [Armatimonas sp.]